MRAVVVARGQLVVQHVVQPLEPQGLLLGQAADRRSILGDERVLTQAGHRQPAERKARGRDRPVRAGGLVVHHAAVEGEQVAAARIIRRAADKIPALSPAHEHDLDQIVVCVHDARVGGGLFVRPADRKQPRRPGQAERRLVFLFDKALDHAQPPLRFQKLWFYGSINAPSGQAARGIRVFTKNLFVSPRNCVIICLL